MNKALVLMLLLAAFLVLTWLWATQSPLPETQPQQSISETARALNVQTPDQAILSDVSGGSASGSALRVFHEGQFTHVIEATLPNPPQGVYFEGWLVRGQKDDADFDFFSTGKMIQDEEGKWVLGYTAGRDYSDYAHVVVTLETRDDRKPEEHILEGTF